MNNDLTTSYRIKQRNRFRVIGQEGLFIQQENAEVVAVNPIGADIVRLIKQEEPLSSLVTAISNDYEVDVATAQKDVLEFVEELEKANLIEKVAD